LSWKRDVPALATSCPEPVQRITSLASSWSRMRSSTRPALVSGTCASCALAPRVLAARSSVSESSVARPRFRPASSAPSTLTSNQLSMERATNW
jgi:hypothetical protein